MRRATALLIALLLPAMSTCVIRANDIPEDDLPKDEPSKPDADKDHVRSKIGGEPFILHSGEFYVSRTLLEQRTSIPLSFEVNYSSLYEFHTAVGMAWSFNFNMRIYETDDILLSAPGPGIADPRRPIAIRKPSGAVTKYTAIPGQSGKFVSYDKEYEIVTKNGDGTYTMMTRSQMTYFFDPDGKLTKIADGKGAELRLTYDAGGKLPIRGVSRNSNVTTPMILVRDFRLTRVEEFLNGTATGVFLNYAYDANGHIQTVTDKANRTVTLRYDPVTGDLLGISDPRQVEYDYTYYSDTRLMKTLEGRGCSDCYMFTNFYDSDKHLTSQVQRNNGFSLSVSYRPSFSSLQYTQLIYTNRDDQGVVTSTRWERVYWTIDAYGVKQASRRIVKRGTLFDEDGVNQGDDYVTFFYYDLTNGRMTNQVDPNGRTNFFIYDERGNLTNETHYVSLPPSAIKQVKEYVYDGNNNLRTNTIYQSDRPNEKFITLYEYDSQNRMTAQKKVPDPTAATWTFITTQYQYDAKGRLVHRVDPRINAIDFEYNDPANPDLPTREFDPANQSYSISRTYDARGNKTSEMDPLGRTTQWLYDDLNRVTRITDALLNQSFFTYTDENLTEAEIGRTASPGRITRYEYDALNHRTKSKRVDDSGNEQVWETYAYDNYGRLLSTKNALNQTTYNEYDPMGWLLKIRRPPLGGLTTDTTYVYDKAGRIASSFDALNVETRYQYDLLNRVTQKTEAYGTTDERITQFAYNALNQVLQKTYVNSTTPASTYSYDGLGRLKTCGGGREYPKTYVYDGNGNVLSITDANAISTAFQYDAYNHQTEMHRFDGGPEFTAYDLVGNVIQRTDGKGNKRYFHYDSMNRLTEESIPSVAALPDGWWQNNALVLVRFGYNPWGDLTSRQDVAAGNTTGSGLGFSSSTFNRLGQLTSKTTTSGLTLTYAYNAADQVTSITYPSVPGSGGGPTTVTYTYNPNNVQLLDSVTDRANNTTTYTYTPRFEKLTETSSLQATTTYQYDNLGRVKSSKNHLLEETLFAYDRFDQVIQITHPDDHGTGNRIETITYDAFGKALTHSGAGQYAMTYTYDPVGNRRTMTDGKSHTTEWVYDARNRVTEKRYAGSPSYHYTYDLAGNLATRTDGKSAITAYTYNAFNLLTLTDYPTDPDVSFSYDNAGRRTQMVDGSGTTSWTYDAAGRALTSIEGRANRVVTYTYGNEDQRLTMDVRPVGSGSGWTTSYGYEAAARLKTITDPHVSATPFTYNWKSDASLITSIVMPSGAQQQKTYDGLGRLQQVKALTSASATVNSFTYQYDEVSQRTTETWADYSKRRYTYDVTRQLATAKKFDTFDNPDSSYDYTYNYDAIGNFTSTVSQTPSPNATRNFTANAANQYTQITSPSVSLTYDDNGSMLTDGTATYSYDQENRLAQVVNGANQVDYIYDGLGRMVERKENGVVAQRFVYDGNLSVAELDASNTELRTYTLGLDLSRGRQGAGGAGGLLARHDSSLDCYYFYDGNGNVVDTLKSDDTVEAHYLYDPFGRIVASSGPLASANSYRFSTKFCDDMAGLICYSHRFYRPDLARWINRDPVGELGGLNLYCYVANRAINRLDLFGLATYFGPPGCEPPTIPIQPFNLNALNELLDQDRRFHAWYDNLPWYDQLAYDLGEDLQGLKTDATKEFGPYGGAGIATLIDLMNFTAIPAAIGHFGEGAGTWAGVPSWDNFWGALGDVSAAILMFKGAFDTGAPFRDAPFSDGCFASGTMIATGDGDRPIEELTKGDCVWAEDMESGNLELREVLEAFRHSSGNLVIIHLKDEEIATTSVHPFWVVDKGWVQASGIKDGDRLITIDGRELDVVCLESRCSNQNVYNITVDVAHNYFVSRAHVLVHNKAFQRSPVPMDNGQIGQPQSLNPLHPEVRPYPDPVPPDYGGGFKPTDVVQDHLDARAHGGLDVDMNKDPKSRESNSIKGGREGQLLRYEQFLRENGMSKADIDRVTAAEWESMRHDVHARAIDPRQLDKLPAPEP